MLAEHLVADRGWKVEVLTTCALDAITWLDELPEGTSDVNGVTVRRIASQSGRDDSFHPLWASLRSDPEHASTEDMERLIDLQGPRSPALLRAVESCDADVIVFYPYLYYPTVRGLPLVSERAVMHPAAHEEPALHLPVFDELFARCRAFVFQTRSERALVTRRFRHRGHTAGAHGSRGRGAGARRGRSRPRDGTDSLRPGRRPLPALHRPG